MKWLRGEGLYALAWVWIGVGIAFKHLKLDHCAIACFDLGVHKASQSAAVLAGK